MTVNLSCLLAVAIVFLAIFQIIGGIKLIPEYQRLVVFRHGKPSNKPKGPGLVFLIPFLDKTRSVDLREQKQEVLNQDATTKDLIHIAFDFCWYYKIIDPIKAVLTVGNSEMMITAIIMTTLRNEIREINSANLSSEFARLNSDFLRNAPNLHDLSEKSGMVVTHIEVVKLAIEGHKKEMKDAQSTIGTLGETQTTVHGSGTVLIGERTWDATSNIAIAPKTKVRVKRVILEIEERQ